MYQAADTNQTAQSQIAMDPSIVKSNSLLAYVPSSASFVSASVGQQSADQILDKLVSRYAILLKNDTFKSSISSGMTNIATALHDLETDTAQKDALRDKIQYRFRC